MAASIVQAAYEELESVAQRFQVSAESIAEMQSRIIQAYRPLAGGSWRGDAADAFQSEMDGDLFPAVARLDEALRAASAVTIQVSGLIKQAEEEAEAVFADWAIEGGAATGGGGGGGGGTSSMQDRLANLGVGTFAGEGGTGGGGADIGSAHSFSGGGGGGGGGGGAGAAPVGATPPAAGAAAAKPPTLKLTDPPMEGEAVTKVQERLIELGYMQPPASGKYDEATMRAVRRFQENADPGSKGDGKVGSITLGNLDKADTLPVSQTANLSHDDAAQRLTDAGIGMDSTDDCSDRNNKRCTSLDQVQSVAIDGVVRLREDSGLPITVTGGTEIGHDNGFEQSHTNGYKIDIRRTDEVDDYIETNYTRIADRGSHPQYQDANGNVYAKEGDHWDITYVNVPPKAEAAPAADPAAVPNP